MSVYVPTDTTFSDVTDGRRWTVTVPSGWTSPDDVERHVWARLAARAGRRWPPASPTVDQLLGWVDNDPDRAAVAFEAEQARDGGPRQTALTALSNHVEPANQETEL